MLKKKSQLKLNSYKIDTDALQSSLRELSQMKSELQTTISYYKSHEDQLILENQRLKEEISILQKKTIDKPDHSSCIAKIMKIESELKQYKKENDKLRISLERQERNSKVISQQYQSKLQKYINENKSLTNKYQQRIAVLNVELKQSKLLAQMNKIQKQNSIKNESVKKMPKPYQKQSSSQYVRSSSQNQQASMQSSRFDKKSQNMVNYNNFKKQKSYQKEETQQQVYKSPVSSHKNNIHIPPKSPTSINRDYKTSHQIYQKNSNKVDAGLNYSYTASYLPNEEDQEIFHASIRKLYNEIKSLGISPREALILPQFKKMASNKNPSRKDIFNFLKNPPLEQKNDRNVQKSMNYIQNAIRSKYGHVNGGYVTQLIIRKVQQYEGVSKLNTQDLQISGMTPSNSDQSAGSYAKLQYKSQNEAKNNNNFQQRNSGIKPSFPSIHDHLNIDSSSSIFR